MGLFAVSVTYADPLKVNEYSKLSANLEIWVLSLPTM